MLDNKHYKSLRNKGGFTLIELLIVIALIGALSAIVIISFNNQPKRARDVQRKSDIKQYQAALELYANNNAGTYPKQASEIVINSMCATLGLTSCPDDPQAGASGFESYKYISDTNGSVYVMATKLEGSDEYFIVCSKGSVGQKPAPYTLSATCPL